MRQLLTEDEAYDDEDCHFEVVNNRKRRKYLF